MRHGEIVQPGPHRRGRSASGRERIEQPIERAVLAKVEQLVLAFEVVIQVAGREVGRGRDVAHPRRRKSDGPEGPRRGAKDVEAARVGAK